jgi:isochorismate synthase
MTDFFIKAKQHFQKNLPFVIYKKPNSELINGLFQNDDKLNFSQNLSEIGFVFTSFDGNKKILIPKNNSEEIIAHFKPEVYQLNSKIESNFNPTDKNNFEFLVSKAIHEIENNSFSKVVLSRKETVDLPNFDLISQYIKVASKYHSALTYCWFHPEIGLWMGATPETLLKVNENKFQTVALAGTQLYQGSEEVRWQKKEKEEQQLVTDYIVEIIRKSVSEVQISVPITFKAGNLLHLKTTIQGIIDKKTNLNDLVLLLHPTPAVGGLPKIKAINFINFIEGYNREFYAGYLGEIGYNDNSKTDLYVNLRCMKIQKNKDNFEANLYIGCGITKDSIPENEWFETVNKAMTLKNVIL